ncbi:MAG: hydantoinase/oxoprolinase family protein [Actinobacteria bacterium]|nr:hydantoinase/oxoprolinase family protein [Actinomycetota bacterium]
MNRVGVDIGGTFTDAISISSDGRISTSKSLTTSGRLADGVVNAISGLELASKEIDYFVHGTTAGLNAFLERRGSRIALITTKGFRDVYQIGRANRPDMYNLKYQSPKPLIPRSDIFEMNERMSPEGETILEVDLKELESIAGRIEGKFDAVAIVLLHSYKSAEHEIQVEKFLSKRLPSVLVVPSHQVAPEWREYERTSTTALSAYIAPIIDEYLLQLGKKLEEIGMRAPIRVMQSNGGVMSASTARAKAIQTLFSGPVGGTIAGVEIGKKLDFDKLICVDMGGTSFDVSLVIDKKADVESQTELQGLPILSPTVSMHTIGAGGGSIAYLAGGALRVGPRSAGAMPGPACYGRGGSEPTVTDANLFLGRLPQIAKLGGNLPLDSDASQRALDSVGTQLKLAPEEVASGIISIVNAAMANAIREITVSRGIDPRDFSLVAFGGAGPLHAIAIAEELELKSVVIPANPGVLSAWGMLQADTRHDQVLNFYSLLHEISLPQFEEALKKLRVQSKEILDSESIPVNLQEFRPAVDLRYVGQEYTVTVEWSDEWSVAKALAELPNMFEAEHLSRYGHNNPGESIELVNIRMSALGLNGITSEQYLPESETKSEEMVYPVYFNKEWTDSKIIQRDQVKIGGSVAGPAVILEPDCTTLLHPGWQAKVAVGGHIVISRSI